MAKADDNAVVKLTGDQTVAGEKTFDVIYAQANAPITNGTGNLGTPFLKWGTAIIESVRPDLIRSSLTTGLPFQNSAGDEKLKVGASTGADVQVTGDLSVSALPTYADEAAAVTGGLATGDIYKTATGELRVKL